ncbi:MAG: YihY/virulence factor BrkB family protein [Acidimicrobiia bacterium]|nr:YihY/virulence factor BrkB family protein [Acidimicrobiia bacterium]
MSKLIDLLAGVVVFLAAGRSVLGKRREDPMLAVPAVPRPAGVAPSLEANAVPTWRRVADYVRTQFKHDNITTHAAAMTYYGLLSLFPALIATVSLYGLISDPAEIEQQIDMVASVLPESAADLVGEQLAEIVGGSGAGLGIGFALSILAALWTASSGVAALVKAVNRIHDATETRSFVKVRLLAMGLTVGIVLFVITAAFVITILPPLIESAGFSEGAGSAVLWLRWPGLGLAMIVGLGVLYRFAPNRTAKWRWITIGAVSATVLWLLASLGLSFYVSNFASYNETYGALGGVIVLLLWIYVSALVVLLGAEIDVGLELEASAST